jgi:hypothetical protein
MKAMFLAFWAFCFLGASAFIKTKNLSAIWLFVAILFGPLSFIIIGALKTKEDLSLDEKTELSLYKMYYRSFFLNKQNYSSVINFFIGRMKKDKNFKIKHAKSILKVLTEDKKNTAWTSISFSVVISFVISFSNNLLNRVDSSQREDFKNSLEKGIISTNDISYTIFGKYIEMDFNLYMQQTIFTLIYCLFIFIGIAGLKQKASYQRLLLLQEAAVLFEESKK